MLGSILGAWIRALSGTSRVLAHPLESLRQFAGALVTIEEALRLFRAIVGGSSEVQVLSPPPPDPPVLQTRLVGLGKITTVVMRNADLSCELLEDHRQRVSRLLTPLEELADLSARAQAFVAAVLPGAVVLWEMSRAVSDRAAWSSVVAALVLGVVGSILLWVIARLLGRLMVRWMWRRLNSERSWEEVGGMAAVI